MLVVCEGCARHVCGGDLRCPFCSITRTRSTLAVLAVSSALALNACATKYAGPPPPDELEPQKIEASTSAAAPGEPSVPGTPTTPGQPSTPPAPPPADAKTPPDGKQPPPSRP